MKRPAKRRVRKPEPFETLRGTCIAHCADVYGPRAGRHVVVCAVQIVGFDDPDRISEFSRWLSRAAAWVADGRGR